MTPASGKAPSGATTRRATLKDIAREAGCSFAAVAKVLNRARGNVRVGPELRERIQAVAAKRGYAPNYGAQALRRGRTDTVGVLMWKVDTPFWGRVLEGICAGLRPAHHHVLVGWPRTGSGPLTEAEELIRQGRIDSLILVGHLSEAERTAVLQSSVRRQLVLAWSPVGSGLPEVVEDPAPGLRQTAMHLAELGHRSMVYCDVGTRWSAARWAVLRAFSAGLGLECRRTRYAALAADPDGTLGDATAVVAANDLTACQVVGVLRGTGRQIPRDVSVVGYDDLHALLAAPPLTTVSRGLSEMGRAAARVALERGGGGTGPRTLTIPSRLIVRASTAAPP
jgi:DNA-binding LacI/PurR family transcriptional regulator